MVSGKEVLKVRPNRVLEDYGTRKSAGVTTNFKIYTENSARVHGRISGDSNTGGARPKPTRRISVPVSGKTVQTSVNHTKKPISQNMEKLIVKRDSSVKINVRRNVLADVSNFQGSFSRKGNPDSFKPTNNESDGRTSLGRVPLGLHIRNANASSRKVFMGKLKSNLGEGHAKQNAKASSDGQRAKSQACSSFSFQRTVAKNLPVETRKSLPVFKRANKVDTSAAKANDEISGNDRGKCTFSVKGKVGQKLVPQVREGRSYLRRSQASNGFVTKVPKCQSNVDSCALPLKSTRAAVKTSIAASNAGRSLKSNSASGSNKSSVATALSKRTEETTASTFSENLVLVVPDEPAQLEVPSDGSNKKMSVTSTGPTTRSKSSRRRSFTSLLMTGSKLLEKYSEIRKKEELPSIDDSCNQLEVSEYVDDIYQYYWVSEAQNPCLADYMKVQTDITPQMRGILINWLIEVHFKFDLMQETLYLAVTLLDWYLSLVTIQKNEMQLVGLTALLLASKYEDFWHPRIKDLISISAESYTRDQLLGMEKLILNRLKFRLNAPTPYVFMLRFLKAAQADTKLEHLAFFLIELSLVQYEALKFKPSLLCASAIYVARCTLQRTPAWTPLLCRHARYDESQIRDCAAVILKFHKAAKTGLLNVTYEKYLRPELGGVAVIKPLNRI